MSDYDNTNRGGIWKNDRKEADTHPDFTGSLNVNGVDYWLSAWKRAPDASPKSPALKLTVKPKEEAKPGKPATPANADFADDDIPF